MWNFKRPAARPSVSRGGMSTVEASMRALNSGVEAVATAAENTAAVLRERADADSFDRPDLRTVAQSWEQFAVELREISTGEGMIRRTETSHANL